MTNEESALAKAFDTTKLVVVGTKNGDGTGDPIVVYFSKFKGVNYLHIRIAWQDRNGDWNPGKGLAVAAENAQSLLKSLGEAAKRI